MWFPFLNKVICYSFTISDHSLETDCDVFLCITMTVSMLGRTKSPIRGDGLLERLAFVKVLSCTE